MAELTAAESRRVRLGTRGSALARWQAEWVKSQLESTGVTVELVLIETTGDVRSGPIGKLATQGVFTKEIQRALLAEQIDVAVHSLKDLPTELVPGLALAAVPPRAPAGDALISRLNQHFEDLPEGACIGTGSLRRRAQLLAARPDLVLRDIRGNIDTRLQKLAAGDFDAIVLAEAGLSRLGLDQHITHVFDKSVLLPAVGQGALGLEVRAEDHETIANVSPLDDGPTHAAVTAERRFLADLRGGCLAPVAAWGRIEDQALRLDAAVLSSDGTTRLQASGTAAIGDATELGARLAAELLQQGASELISASRQAFTDP